MQAERITLSEQQEERMERFASRFPATSFVVTAQDPYSRALTVEVEDLETSTVLTVSASGRTLEA